MPRRNAKTISLFHLTEQYKTEQDAVRYFEQLRWGDKPVCVKCGCSGRITKQKNYKKGYWCGDCREYFTAFTNTPLEHSRVKDARKWLFAAYLLMTARKGISAMQLSKELSVSYPTSWYMMHRLRMACGDSLEALRGIVEVDETYIGGKEGSKHNSKKLKGGRGTAGKQAVLGMRERAGRVKAMTISNADRETLHSAINQNVEVGATICTDDHRGYIGLPYKHETVKHSAKEYVNGMAHTNGIESVWALLKRGYNGVYHNWSRKHCCKYVNEFTFRLNEGNCERDTQDRLDDLFRAMSGKTITYKELTT